MKNVINLKSVLNQEAISEFDQTSDIKPICKDAAVVRNRVSLFKSSIIFAILLFSAIQDDLVIFLLKHSERSHLRMPYVYLCLNVGLTNW